MDNVEHRLTQCETKIDNLENQFNRIESKQDSTLQSLTELKTILTNQIPGSTSTCISHSSRLSEIEVEVKSISQSITWVRGVLFILSGIISIGFLLLDLYVR